MPPLALACEHLAGLRHLRPGDRVGDEGHLVPHASLQQVAMQPHDEIEVFHHTGRAVAVDGEHVLLAEQPERARDDEVPPQAIPSETAEQERAEVLDHLDAGEEAARHPGVGHAPVLHGAAIRHSNRPSDGGDVAAQQERAREPQERVRLDEGVGVHGDHEREAAGVDRGVQ